MGRPRLHDDAAMLDAARDTVLDCGAGSTTVEAIARRGGMPNGSLYHRFGSRESLLTEVWIRAARRSQEAFVGAIQDRPDPTADGLAAALATFDFAREQAADAQLLVTMRLADLGIEAPSDVNRPVERALAGLARRLYGSAGRARLDQVALACIDLPQGAVRRHLAAGTRPPGSARAPLALAVAAVLGHDNPKEKR